MNNKKLYLNGTKVISLVLVSHPRLDPTNVKYFNSVTIDKIETKVHNQEVGASNFDKFQSLVVSAEYLSPEMSLGGIHGRWATGNCHRLFTAP